MPVLRSAAWSQVLLSRWRRKTRRGQAPTSV